MSEASNKSAKTRRMGLLIAGLFIVLVIIVYFAGFYPPPESDRYLCFQTYPWPHKDSDQSSW